MRGGGGNSDKDDGFAGIIRAITPLAKPALEALPAIAAMQAQRTPPPRPALVQAPVRSIPPANPAALNSAPPAPPSGAPMQPTDIPSEDSNMLAQLKPQIDSLVAMATQGSDATGAADLIFDQVFMDPDLPDAIYEKLAGFVDSDQFVNYVTIMNPAAKPHTAWFDTFKAQVVKRLTADEMPESGNGAVIPAGVVKPQ
jgi:hypothetical protein